MTNVFVKTILQKKCNARKSNLKINRIYNENCLDTIARMPNDFIDLTVTSPPYDNLRDYKGYSFDFESIAKELFRVTKKGGVIVWVVNDATIKGSETGASFRQALFFKDCGLNLHDTMIYSKRACPFPEVNRYYSCFEYMFILSKGKPKTFNAIKDRKNKYAGKKNTSTQREKDGTTRKHHGYGKTYAAVGVRFNIWDVNAGYMKSTTDKEAFKHPAIFPESLANDHIMSWSKPGDLIYDPFTGSGTTGKMAKLNRRRFVGSELSLEYCKIAVKRIRGAMNA